MSTEQSKIEGRSLINIINKNAHRCEQITNI